MLGISTGGSTGSHAYLPAGDNRGKYPCQGSASDNCQNSNARSSGYAHRGATTGRNREVDPNSHAGTDGSRNPFTDSHANGHPGSHTDRTANSATDAYSRADVNCHTHTQTDTCSHSDPPPDIDSCS